MSTPGIPSGGRYPPHGLCARPVTPVRLATLVGTHRAPGSIGGCATPGRVFKGMRMAGRMGNDTVTTQNLTVHAVDAEAGLLLIKGAIPGRKGGIVVIRDAVKGGATK